MSRHGIRPYVVKDSGKSSREICDHVNDTMFQSYSSDFTAGSGLGKVVANPFMEYERLLCALSEVSNSAFATMENAIAGKCDRDKVLFVIRHDMDGDIVAARQMAELEHRYGIAATYYVLHTCLVYYGYFKKGVFYRHNSMADYYREFLELGHEVSLHTDPLLIYQDYQVDGAQAVVEEIQWLRSMGLRIPGSAAHNHYTVYGAQNFEIFKGRVRNFIMSSGVDMPKVDVDEVVHNGKWAPLHVLDEKELGLTYESYDIFTLPGYLGIMADRNFNTIWQTWNQRRRFGERGLANGPGDRDSVFDALAKVRPGEIVVFTVHPLFYGARPGPGVAPPMRINSVTVRQNRRLGWWSYKPGSLVAVSEDQAGRQELQAIHFANEWGMLSRPHVEQEGLRVLILGGGNIDARTVGIPDQLEYKLEQGLSERLSCPVEVRSFAFPGMGVSRYASWYAHIRRYCRADIVIMGIGSQAGADSHPDLWDAPPDELRADVGRGGRPSWWGQAWRRLTGGRRKEVSDSGGEGPSPSSGRFLKWDPKTGVVGWTQACAARKFSTKPEYHLLMAQDPDKKIGQVPWFRYLESCYRFLADQVRQDGATPLLLIEAAGESVGALDVTLAEPTGEFYTAFLQKADAISRSAGAALVNPYPALLSHDGPGRAFDRANRWSHVGQRIVARELERVIFTLDRLTPCRTDSKKQNPPEAR